MRVQAQAAAHVLAVPDELKHARGQVQEKFANAKLSPEEAADRLLKEGRRELVRKEMAEKELQPGVKGSGVVADSLASHVQVRAAWPGCLRGVLGRHQDSARGPLMRRLGRHQDSARGPLMRRFMDTCRAR